MSRILFPGSFDPFTIGHQSLVERALNMADEVIIAIGINENKKSCFSLEKRIKAIENLYAECPNVKVVSYNKLTADFALECGATYILRGIRSVIDFEYEKNIADVNRSISGVETIFLLAEPGFSHISSSVVRELMHFGKDVSEFLPKIVEKEIR